MECARLVGASRIRHDYAPWPTTEAVVISKRSFKDVDNLFFDVVIFVLLACHPKLNDIRPHLPTKSSSKLASH